MNFNSVYTLILLSFIFKIIIWKFMGMQPVRAYIFGILRAQASAPFANHWTWEELNFQSFFSWLEFPGFLFHENPSDRWMINNLRHRWDPFWVDVMASQHLKLFLFMRQMNQVLKENCFCCVYNRLSRYTYLLTSFLSLLLKSQK